MSIRFRLNGREVESLSPPDRRVSEVLREEFGLTGTKEGCGAGECGSCAVLLDGRAVLSCLMLAGQLPGRSLTTAEGLGRPDAPHPVQAAFAAHGAVQCGFCAPGMTIAAADLLAKNPAPGRAEIREAVSGNLCRCGAYQKIVDAVAAAAGPPPEEKA